MTRLRTWMFTLLPMAAAADAAVHDVPGSFATVTAALGAAAPGDTVAVAAGTYSPSSNGESFPLVIGDAGVRLLGAGVGLSVLDAESTAGVLEFNVVGAGGEISGFTVTGGAAANGGGIWVRNGTPEVRNNLVVGNSATGRGAGMRANNSSAAWIHHNVIWQNFDGNLADGNDPHGVILEGTSTGIFEHNLIGRTDGNGLLTAGTAIPVIRHNIFLQNGVPGPPARGRGICALSTSGAQIHHNLFFANQVAALLWTAGGGDVSGTVANDVSTIDGVYGNVDGDPLLADPDGGDYALTAGSPAVDAGDPSLPPDPDGTVADLGPYYFHQNTVGSPPFAGADPEVRGAPNPFRESTEIRFALPHPAALRVDVHDVAGRRVRTLVESRLAAGTHFLTWDGRDDRGAALPSGVFFVRVAAGGAVRTAPLLLLR
ncbi:MAG: right-handed parallel beta-helix repeat-containing protein [Candidatus Eiseniibacteriota bacterium]